MADEGRPERAQRPSQRSIDLYNAYTHGLIERRAFLAELARLAGGAGAATALLSILANDYARARPIVAETDRRIAVSTARFDTGDIVDLIEPEELQGRNLPNAGVIPTRHLPFVTAYAARPKGAQAPPAVIVIHENRGLNPHIEDVARRLAIAGFAAYAVDMLSPFGGTPRDEDRARSMIGKLNADKTVAKLSRVAARLETDARHGGKVGAVGFCWGGGMVNRLAANAPGLDAGVSYYGRQASADEAVKIKSPLLLHYAARDQRVNQGIDAFRTALDTAGVDYTLHMYEGAQHAFNNDTNAARYNKAAADLAWSRTLAFFDKHLRMK